MSRQLYPLNYGHCTYRAFKYQWDFLESIGSRSVSGTLITCMLCIPYLLLNLVAKYVLIRDPMIC